MKTIEHDDVTVIDGDYGYEESDESKAFNDFRDKFKDEEMGTLRVHRVPVTNKTTNAAKLRTVYLFSCPIDAFIFEDLLEYIRDNYSGGTFRLIGTRAGQRGNAFNRLVEIEAPKRQSGIPGAENVVSPGGGNVGEIINQLGAVMLEQATRVEEMMRGSATPIGDPLDQVTKMMNAVGTVIDTMGLKPQASQSIVDQLAEFKALQELFGGGGDAGGSDANLYTLLTEAVKNFGGPLMKAVALAQEQGTISPDGVMRPPALPAPAEAESPAPSGSLNLKEMREQLEFLLTQAKNDVDHAMVADFIIEQMPEDDAAYDGFERFLQDEKCLDRCAMIQPEVNQHREWFLAWRQVMLDKLDKMIEADEPEEEQPGLTNGGDKNDDAATDAGDSETTSHEPGGHEQDALDNAAAPKNGDPIDPDGHT